MQRVYEKPAVVYKEKIEGRAGACAKVGVAGCGSGPYNS